MPCQCKAGRGRHSAIGALSLAARLEPARTHLAPDVISLTQSQGDDGKCGIRGAGRGLHAAVRNEQVRHLVRAPVGVGDALRRVVAVGSGFVALGESSPGTGAAWQSADGTSWTQLNTAGIFSNGSVSAIGAVGGRVVLFGVGASGQTIVAVSSPL